MRHLGKRLATAAFMPAALLARWCSGAVWRTACLAWARANLGNAAVPLDNQFLGLVHFEGTRRVRIGRNCRIDKHVRFETEDHGEIIIGDNVVISPGTVIVAHERITIESHVMIGEYCTIRDQDHRIDVPGHIRDSGFVTAPVRIHADVWLGRGCVVLKGVTVGEKAVIGANSVVTRDVPAGQVCAGVPARVLRERAVCQPV